jgi:hypothetical protein
VNDLPNRLSRRSTLAVVGAASAVGLASVGRLAAAGSQPPPPSGDALVVDDKGRVGIGKTPDPNDNALLDVGGKIKSLDLTVNGPVDVSGALSFGARQGQLLNLWTTSNAIGIQLNTQYFRTTKNFAWFTGGTHNDHEINPGGGTVAMALSVDQLAVNGFVKATKFVGGGAELSGPLTITLPSVPVEKEKSLALAISGNHYLEFGAGIKKQANNGKIGYKLFGDGLDVVGAGEKVDLSDRKITLHTQGGLTVNGPILMDGFLGQYNNSITNAPKAKVEARVKEVLEKAPVGTFMFYLINRGKDPRYAWKDADNNVYSTSVGSSGKDTL